MAKKRSPGSRTRRSGPTSDEDRRAVSLVGAVADSTERKQAEEALRESEHRYRTLFDSLQEGFYLSQTIFGDDGKPCDFTYLDVNPAFERIMGLPRDQIIGRRATELVPSLKPGWAEVFGKVQLTGEPVRYDSYSEHFHRHFEAFVFRPSPGQVAVLVTDITERKRAEDALKESERRERERAEELAVLLEAVPLAVFIARDPDCLHLTGNRLADEILRIPHGDELSLSGSADTRPHHFKALRDGRELRLDELPAQRAARGERVKDFDFSLVFGDGMVRHLSGYGTPLLDDQGLPRGTVAVLLDITERKRAEEALREAKGQLDLRVQERTAELTEAYQTLRRTGAYTRSLIEASLDPLVTIAPDGTITDVNAATEAATGRTRQELVGTDFSTYFTEPDHALAGYQRVFQEGSVRDYPLEIRHRDGHTVPVLYNAALYRDEAGQVVGIFAAARDITERKRAEEALRQSEQEFRSLAEAMPQIVWATRADGWNIYFNQQWVDYTGMTMEESHGHGWNTPFHPDDKKRAWDAWQHATKHNEPYSLECRLRRADGVYRWWLVRGSPMLGPDGEVLKWFGACTDIEDIKNAETALREAYETLEHRVAERTAELARSNEDLQQFAYVASHDLQEPLRMVTGFLKLLHDRYEPQLDGKAKEYIAFSIEGATRMSQLITDLLAYSRVGSHGNAQRPTEAGHALAGAMANLRGTIHEAGATVTQDELPTVQADPMQLMQLLQNLVGNAIKFRSPDRPCQVHVSARRKGGQWVFSVRDNGIGIPAEHFDRIFVIFQRLHTRDKYPGTGIGLAICKKIVDRHGGKIWVESKLGEGSTFYFAL